MAANKIKLTIQVNDDGSLGIVGKKAKEAAAATDKLDKSSKKLGKTQSATYRTMQGAAHTSSNLTKNFSKQSQGISGVLVPAYAALAANIFAVTALFGALSRAAQVEQLTNGLSALGNASGIAMNTLSRGLQKATGNALSLEDAMRATALTLSGGFGAETLERLGEVARNASIALGRDTTDSLNRLVRGATKLEPELLDELGIMVRLDEAAQDYARANNKLASELTLTEKRQAFMNAVLAEGEKKFTAIGESVDTNPYDRLSASFSDLSKTVLGGVNTALVPAINLLSESTAALVGTLTIFGTTVLRSMAPSITDIGTRYQELASSQAETSEATLGFVSNLDNVPAKFKSLQAGLEGSSNKTKDLEEMVKSANKSISQNTSIIENGRKGQAASAAQVARSTERIRQSTIARNAATAAIQSQAAAEILLEEAQIAGLVSAGRYSEGYKRLPELFSKIDENYKKGIASTNLFAKANSILGATFAKLAVRVRLFGLALVQSLPLIGGIVVGVAALTGLAAGVRKLALGIQGLTDDVERLAAATDHSNKVTAESKDIFAEIQKALEGNSSKIKTQTALNTAQANSIRTQVSAMKELNKEITTGGNTFSTLKDAQQAYVNNLLRQSEITPELNKQFRQRLKEEGLLNSFNGLLTMTAKKYELLNTIYKDTIGKQLELIEAQEDFSTALTESQKPLADFRNSLRVTTPYDEAVAAIGTVNTALNKLKEVSSNAKDNKAIEKRLRAIAEAATGSLGDTFTKELREKLSTVRTDGLGALSLDPQEQRLLVNELENELRKREEVLTKLQEAAIETKSTVAAATAQAKILEKIQFSEENVTKLVEAKNKAANAQLKEQNALLAGAQQELITTENKFAVEQKIKGIKAKIVEITDSIIDSVEKEQMVTEATLNNLSLQQKGKQALLDIQQALNTAAEATLALEEQRSVQQAKLSSQGAGRGFIVTAEQEFEIAKNLFEDRKTAVEEERKIRDKGIELEYALLEAQLAVQKSEIDLINFKHKQEVIRQRLANEQDGLQADNPIEDLIATGPLEAAMKRVGEARTAAFTQSAAEETQALEGLVFDVIEKGFAARKAAATREQKEALDRLQTEQAGQKALNDIVQKTISSEKELLDEKRQSLEANARAQSLSNPAIQEEKITAAQRADIEKKLQDDRIAIVVKERDLKIAMINMEHDLLKARLAVAKAESVFRLKELNFTDEQINEVTKNFDSAIATVQNSRSSAIGAVGLVASNEIVRIIDDVATASRDAVNEAAGKTTGETGNVTGPYAGLQSQAQNVSNMFTKENGEFTTKLSDRVGAVAKFGLELQNVFSQFGPENPMMTAALEGAVAMSATWGTAFSEIKEHGLKSKEGISAAFGAIGTTIGAIAGIQKAASEQRIAGIDQEIAAERKRDGKSAASVERIKALEKKKEAEKRKAFERDKKMQMARVVMGTASAIISALQTDPFVPAGLAMAGVAAAMGAAQLATISSMSYQGGGSGAANAGGPSSIAIGSRKTSVDIANSKSARGELAYFRGAQGTGGPENFKPAFAGARYRAAGGETAGYVVGEQGPELFVPDAPGTIVPNDDIAAGAPVNATFNISAIDASGVEEVLVQQRGNIIGMIREAANSYGEEFIEGIDTSVYTPSAGGVSRY